MVAAGSRRRRHVRSNGEFGKVERTRVLDYYDGELQFIDLEAISHWVTLARKVPDSEGRVMEKTRQAQEERSRDGWYIGIWEVNDPSVWMEFTYHRYIAKSGADPISAIAWPLRVHRDRRMPCRACVGQPRQTGVEPVTRHAQ